METPALTGVYGPLAIIGKKYCTRPGATSGLHALNPKFKTLTHYPISNRCNLWQGRNNALELHDQQLALSGRPSLQQLVAMQEGDSQSASARKHP